MRPAKLLVPFILVIFFFTSCDVQEVELVGVENIELVSMKNNIMEFNVSARINNPNSFNIKMIDSDLDFYLEKNLMGKAHLLNPITLKKNSDEVYTIQVQTDVINQAQLLPIILKTALTGKVNVGVKGDVKGKVYFISRSVKINMEDDVDIKQDLFKK